MLSQEGDEEKIKEEKGNSKQIINQTNITISINKSWKEFKQIKNWNQTNSLFTLWTWLNHQETLQQFHQVIT